VHLVSSSLPSSSPPIEHRDRGRRVKDRGRRRKINSCPRQGCCGGSPVVASFTRLRDHHNTYSEYIFPGFIPIISQFTPSPSITSYIGFSTRPDSIDKSRVAHLHTLKAASLSIPATTQQQLSFTEPSKYLPVQGIRNNHHVQTINTHISETITSKQPTSHLIIRHTEI